jgi:hypothetical protein|tara:strand:+ start:710 stop:895 length:186 start_codon:yes stop_codon:yes gene_type:complete
MFDILPMASSHLCLGIDPKHTPGNSPLWKQKIGLLDNYDKQNWYHLNDLFGIYPQHNHRRQ